MNTKYHRFGVWCGIGFFLLFWITCINFMDFIPPHSPLLTGQELVAIYKNRLIGIQSSIMVAYLAATMLVPWSAVVYAYMSRIEGGPTPILSFTAFGAGIMNAVAFCLPFLFWAAASYRMERNPELILLFNDTSWLIFVMVYAPWSVQTMSIGFVGLSDKSSTPTFPRWFCFFSLWAGILAIPGGFATLFKTGPFAWNGLFAFWLVVTVFCIYYAMLFPLMFKAIKRQEAKDLAAVTGHPANATR